uniref:LYR motif-containing protein 4 isoform X4 n=1 Tax=Callithrix jacchus TaxID=9483 RepID=UPI00159D3162|nr:LYR motif-containing protein 4 isoform X4 [Callithrix jacchus]
MQASAQISPSHRGCPGTTLSKTDSLPCPALVFLTSLSSTYYDITCDLVCFLPLLQDHRDHEDRDLSCHIHHLHWLGTSMDSKASLYVLTQLASYVTLSKTVNLSVPNANSNEKGSFFSHVHIGQLYSTDKLIIENRDMPRT